MKTLFVSLFLTASVGSIGGDSWKPVVRSGSQAPTFGSSASQNPDSLFTVNPGNPNFLYAIDSGGILWQSFDAGETWRLVFGQLQTGFRAVAISAANPNTVYAISLESFYRSNDAGATWRSSGLPKIAGVGPVDLAADAVDAGVLYATIPKYCVITCNDSGVMTSRDSGQHWTPALLPADMSWLIADPIQRGVVYGRDSDGPVYRTTDAGNSWHIIRSPWPIAIDPVVSTTIYGALQSFMRSDDRGEQWLQLGDFPPVTLSNGRTHIPSAVTIVVNPTNRLIIDVGTDFGAYRSIDGGKTWKDNSVGLCCPTGSTLPYPIYHIAYDRDGRLFAATITGLFVLSADPPRRRAVHP